MVMTECPGKNLEIILRALNPVAFEDLKRRGRNLYEYALEEVRAMNPLVPSEDLEAIAREIADEERKERKALIRQLLKYGNSRKKIIKALGEHVQEHPLCLQNYFEFLIREAEKDIYIRSMIYQKIGIQLPEEDIEMIAKELDKKEYLGIMRMYSVIF